MNKRTIKALLIIIVFILAVILSSHISNNLEAQRIINNFGYTGILVLAFLGGLNFIIPIPATTFLPVFLSSDLTVLGIIVSLVIGTTIADLIAYYIAIFIREKTNIENVKFLKKLEEWNKKNKLIPLLILFLWASFMPLPNEFILVPLGVLGFKLRSLILPFILGNIIHNTIVTLGVSSLIIF